MIQELTDSLFHIDKETSTSIYKNNVTERQNASTVLSDTQEKEACERFLFYLNTIILGAICLFGLTGNTLSLLVLRKEQGNKTAVLLLQALAIVDNFLLLVAFTALSVLNGAVPFIYGLSVINVYRPYVIKYINPVGYIAWTANVWITVLLAVNR